MNLQLQRILMGAGALAVLGLAWSTYGWPGVAIATGGMLMWLLLHFTRMMQVLKRASDSPVGYVASAVMLNARLKPRVNLLHVMSLTRAIGEQLSAKDQQPEIFRWTDPGGSSVTCEFVEGRLVKWTMYRPPAESETAVDTPATAASPAAH